MDLPNREHCVLGPHGELWHGLSGRVQGTEGGSPVYSGRQKHTADPDTTRHPVYGPHGLGEHSSPSGTEKRDSKWVNIVFR
jgi:hypothetical protein